MKGGHPSLEQGDPDGLLAELNYLLNSARPAERFFLADRQPGATRSGRLGGDGIETPDAGCPARNARPKEYLHPTPPPVIISLVIY